ncbi:hypothetical protein DFH05DRAFT_1458554 [Lentinula detonsa]|uniref:Uncharacterized protein n=1 Tax=Lentinula detonsa TaxID=2804962 RepID=A0A9W8TZ12_9AGAR|nr:hypothetical protein DFH05DRAFT_1458554 [Lentinula detonsa]
MVEMVSGNVDTWLIVDSASRTAERDGSPRQNQCIPQATLAVTSQPKVVYGYIRDTTMEKKTQAKERQGTAGDKERTRTAGNEFDGRFHNVMLGCMTRASTVQQYSSSEGDEESGDGLRNVETATTQNPVSATPSPSCSESSGIAGGDSKTKGSLMKASTGPGGATVKKEDIEANESIRYGGVASKALNRLMLTALTGKLCALLTKQMKDRLLTVLALQLQSGKVEHIRSFHIYPLACPWKCSSSE